MKSYRVMLTLTQKELIDFIDKNFMSSLTVIPLVEEQAAAEPGTPNPRHQDTDAIYTPQRGPRKKRGSKVVETILDALQGGEAGHPNALKAALSNAGMSENSLSTGLAILQKAGTIKRDGNGNYYLAVKEAAE